MLRLLRRVHIRPPADRTARRWLRCAHADPRLALSRTQTLNDNEGAEVDGKISRGEEAYELLEAAYKGGVNFFDVRTRAIDPFS